MKGQAFVVVMGSLLGAYSFMPSALAQIDISPAPGALEQSIFEHYNQETLPQQKRESPSSRQRRIREGMRRLRQDQAEMHRLLQNRAEMRRQRMEAARRLFEHQSKMRRIQRREKIRRQLRDRAEIRRQRREEINSF